VDTCGSLGVASNVPPARRYADTPTQRSLVEAPPLCDLCYSDRDVIPIVMANPRHGPRQLRFVAAAHAFLERSDLRKGRS